MMTITVHHQVDNNGGMDQEMFVNGFVMNAIISIKVQMQLVRIADKANNLIVKVHLYNDQLKELHRQSIVHLHRLHMQDLRPNAILDLIMVTIRHLISNMVIIAHLKVAQNH